MSPSKDGSEGASSRSTGALRTVEEVVGGGLVFTVLLTLGLLLRALTGASIAWGGLVVLIVEKGSNEPASEAKGSNEPESKRSGAAVGIGGLTVLPSDDLMLILTLLLGLAGAVLLLTVLTGRGCDCLASFLVRNFSKEVPSIEKVYVWSEVTPISASILKIRPGHVADCHPWLKSVANTSVDAISCPFSEITFLPDATEWTKMIS
jgi:hypothetical protein